MSGVLAALHLQQHIGMTTTTFLVTKLLSAHRIELAIQAMAGAANVGHLADENDVSRKFVYQQKTKARDALEDAYLRTTGGDDVVLFYFLVTKAWLHQVALPLALISHSSCRGGVEFMRDILGVSISAGGVHNLHQLAARRAGEINRVQDLSCIRDGLHDEIFNCNEPVLVGVDAHPHTCDQVVGIPIPAYHTSHQSLTKRIAKGKPARE